ncbi:MAG: hypothetical protein ACXVUE_09360 [Solirubrobacteraceae bacterium]
MPRSGVGLATPGVILAANGIVQVAGALNLPICMAILAASALPRLRRPRRARLLLVAADQPNRRRAADALQHRHAAAPAIAARRYREAAA